MHSADVWEKVLLCCNLSIPRCRHHASTGLKQCQRLKWASLLIQSRTSKRLHEVNGSINIFIVSNIQYNNPCMVQILCLINNQLGYLFKIPQHLYPWIFLPCSTAGLDTPRGFLSESNGQSYTEENLRTPFLTRVHGRYMNPSPIGAVYNCSNANNFGHIEALINALTGFEDVDTVMYFLLCLWISNIYSTPLCYNDVWRCWCLIIQCWQ